MSAQARIIGGHLGAGYHSWEQPKSTVTESGVRLLTAQKPMKRQAWWNGKFALFQRPAAGMGEGQLPPTDNQWARAFIDGGRELRVETAQSALAVILKLVIGGLTSIILTVLSTVNLQFQGRFVPISLRPILRIVAASVMAPTAWASCS